MENAMNKAITAFSLALMLTTHLTATVAVADDQPAGISYALVNASPLANVPGKNLTAVTVELAPGALLPAHTHAGFVFAYVLEGTVRSQLNQGESVDYTTGQSWVEPPGTIHSLTQNPSSTETTTILAVFVAQDGAELTHFGGDH
jgi:quercetin dioxygenase-like cupin family protein